MKKEIVIPLLLFVLGLIFIIINILVFFTKGNAWFISKKLKVGAMILSLTGVLACGSPPKPTCYDTAPSKENTDSIAKVKKQDSINTIEKQKYIDDSSAIELKKQMKKDSLAKIKHKKKPPIIKPICYHPAPNNCFTPVKNQKD